MGDIAYKFLSSGELEIPVRGGFQLIAGCSCKGIFEFSDRMAELGELLSDLSAGENAEKPLDAIYMEHSRFRYLCDRILTLNGIEPDWIRPKDLGWLLFGHHDAEGNLRPSPLQQLNAPVEPRHPRRPKPQEGPSDFISILAAIAMQPDTSAEEAFRIATSQPARDVLGMLQDRSWHSLSDEQKDDEKFGAWAAAEAQKMQQQPIGGWGKPQQRPPDLPREKVKGG
ncbi:MAG TPA: hypothetical protein V6D29_04980 [Leptolyngbyaceae cyanobacterium]